MGRPPGQSSLAEASVFSFFLSAKKEKCLDFLPVKSLKQEGFPWGLTRSPGSWNAVVLPGGEPVEPQAVKTPLRFASQAGRGGEAGEGECFLFLPAAHRAS